MAINTIMFELVNVLVKSNKSLIYQGWSQFLNGDMKVEPSHAIGRAESMFDQGGIDSEDFYQAVRRAYNLPISQEIFYKIWNSGIEFIESSEDLLKRIKANGHKLVVLSDINPEHIIHIATNSRILSYFNSRVLSYETGFVKPSYLSYLEALRLSGASYNEVLYVDNVEENIKAAKKSGIRRTILHTSLEATIIELEKQNMI